MRVLAAGSRELMDGFGLLGIETFANIDLAELEALLLELVRAKEKALIYLQSDLAGADLPVLQNLRSEGGTILISEVPDILSAGRYEAPVDALIERVLGGHAAGGVS